MLFSLRRSGNLAAGIAVFGILFSLSSPVLADEGVNYTASRVLPVDGEPADQKKSPSDKVLRVAQSAGDSWVVREITAPVRREGTDRAVVVGDRMATGDRLITGPGGQAVLVRRRDKISMSPNSDMKVGDNKGDSLFTDIVQTLGTLLFQVEKNPRQRFRVGTPYLAAIVKGTTFTVSVRPEGAAVHVTDGAVQVAARGSQRAVIVRPGQTGSVSSKPGAEWRSAGAKAKAPRLRVRALRLTAPSRPITSLTTVAARPIRHQPRVWPSHWVPDRPTSPS